VSVIITLEMHPWQYLPARGGKSEFVLLPRLKLWGRLVAEFSRLLQASEVLRQEWILEATIGQTNRVQKRIGGDGAISGIRNRGIVDITINSDLSRPKTH